MADKFKAVLSEPDLLRDSINVISSIINEGTFKLTKSGIELQSMDSANVAMINMKLLATAFKKYELDKDISIGVNIADLTSVIKRVKPTEEITLELKDNMLSIEFSGEVKRAFKIPLLDIKEESKTPSLDFSASVEVKTSVIEDSINDAEIVSDAAILEADPDSFKIRAEGENRKAEMKLEKGNDSLINLKAKDHVKSTFPLDYLKRMAKAAKLADTVVLQLGNDYPLRLDFKVVDRLQLGFVLAPRIESE